MRPNVAGAWFASDTLMFFFHLFVFFCLFCFCVRIDLLSAREPLVMSESLVSSGLTTHSDREGGTRLLLTSELKDHLVAILEPEQPPS